MVRRWARQCTVGEEIKYWRWVRLCIDNVAWGKGVSQERRISCLLCCLQDVGQEERAGTSAGHLVRKRKKWDDRKHRSRLRCQEEGERFWRTAVSLGTRGTVWSWLQWLSLQIDRRERSLRSVSWTCHSLTRSSYSQIGHTKGSGRKT